MKIRRPWVIQTICLLGYWLVRALLATVFCKYWRTGRDFRPSILKPNERFIYAMWHEYLIVPMIHFNTTKARILVSQHADGLIVAEFSKLCKHMIVIEERRSFLERMVFPRVAEHVSCDGKGQAFGQR